MPKERKKDAGGYPCIEARDKLTEVVIRFFKDTPLEELKERYIKHEQAGMVAFQENMERLMREALVDDEWQQDRSISNFEKWLKNAARDATWNLKMEVERMKKRKPAPEGDNLFTQAVECWASMSKKFTNRIRRQRKRILSMKEKARQEREGKEQAIQPGSVQEEYLDTAEELERQASAKCGLVGREGDVGEP